MVLPLIPLILGGAALSSALFGAKEGLDAVADNSKAEDLQLDAQVVYEQTERDLKYTRRVSTETLERLGKLKLEIWDQQLGRFIKLYEQIKNVELTRQPNTGEFNLATFTRDELAQMKDISLKAHEVMLGGTSAVGSGALVGMASYGGAMMFASASTGTAISTLAGAAATNATLAWFGGGSVAVGGLGMAGGMAVLGGIVAGPVLAIGGLMMAAKAREKLANARIYKGETEKAVKEMEHAMNVLDSITEVAQKFDQGIQRLSRAMIPVVDGLEDTIITSGTNYANYNQSQKRQVYLTVEFAKVLKLFLETPLINKEGALEDENCAKVLKQGQLFLRQG